MSLNPHNYRRPGWLCVVDGEEWPCAARRAFWLEKYTTGEGRMWLRGILGAMTLDAEKDLNRSHFEMHDRFINWTFTAGERATMVWPEGVRVAGPDSAAS